MRHLRQPRKEVSSFSHSRLHGRLGASEVDLRCRRNRRDRLEVCCSWTFDGLLAAGFLEHLVMHRHCASVQYYKDNASPATLPSRCLRKRLSSLTKPTRPCKTSGSTPLKLSTLPESNSACSRPIPPPAGGFAGASDSYAAGLHLIDLALQGASIDMRQIPSGGFGPNLTVSSLLPRPTCRRSVNGRPHPRTTPP